MFSQPIKRFVLLLPTLLFVFIYETQTTECLAQQNVKRIINGQVRDAETGTPLGSANVYLSNTTIGASSDTAGKFFITNIPTGVYDMVVSLVGYERQIIQLQIISPESLYYDVKLIPKILATNEVEITSDQPTEWKENLDRFVKVFFGKSDFADSCTITNPEIINFRFFNDTLIAQTDSILQINNMVLGYRIHLILKEFVWNVDKDFGHYLIYPLFVPMQTVDIKKQTEWTKNRQKAYLGSFRHFLKALVHKNTEENMFRIFAGRRGNLFYGKGHRINPEDFEIEPFKGTPIFSLNFKGSLLVEYGKFDINSTSIITMNLPYTYIDSLGNLFNPLSIEVSGMWANKRVSELVPMY